MQTKKKIPSIATAIFLIICTLVGVGVAAYAGRVASELQASVLGKTKTKRYVKNKLIRPIYRFSAESPDPKTLCKFSPPEKPEYKGEFIERELKRSTEEGGIFVAAFYLKNTGNVPWLGDSSECANRNFMRLGTAREQDRASVFFNRNDPQWIAANRISMTEKRVDPGEIATFTFKSIAPKVSDIFREYWRPVVEEKAWLTSKEAAARLDVYVGDINEETSKQLFYLGKSGQASSMGDVNGTPFIHVDISEQKLRLALGDNIVREYTVSTGTFNTPTPLGKFKILNKQELRIGNRYPHYRMPMWQGFTVGGAGFHGLPYLANDNGVFWKEALSHIGQRVSHGCVRLLQEDSEDFYNLTTEGIEVVVHN